MTAIDQIAYHLDRRDEVPNQELAGRLARDKDRVGIKEIASYLNDKNTSIQSDCIKVLYEIGYLDPGLITPYAGDFLELLESKHNRMVWGAMIALSTIAEYVPEKIVPRLERIKELIDTGTVITNVSGVKTLINLCKAGEKYSLALKDDLIHYQKECRDVDFAKRAEDMWIVIRPEQRDVYRKVLEERLPDLSKAARKRLNKVILNLEN